MRAAVAIARVDRRFGVIFSTFSFTTFKLSHLQKHIKGLWLLINHLYYFQFVHILVKQSLINVLDTAMTNSKKTRKRVNNGSRRFYTCFSELITLQTRLAFLVWNKSLNLCCPKALQFSECMVTLFTSSTSISKPELYYRKLGLVSEETAVFKPYIVILVTVTAITGVCTRVSHPACALTIARCSAPVRHLSRIT